MSARKYTCIVTGGVVRYGSPMDSTEYHLTATEKQDALDRADRLLEKLLGRARGRRETGPASGDASTV